MHKITSKPITIDNFEIDDLDCDFEISEHYNFTDFIHCDLIPVLENLRLKYLETNDKKYWKELIRWLPEGWVQTRTITMNYENLLSMAHQREFHKLVEWSGKDSKQKSFINFVKALPYANDLIFCLKD